MPAERPSSAPIPPGASPARRESKRAFARFVRMLGAEWRFVLPAFGCVLLSGFTLGVGMLGASPILDNILGAKKDLPVFAREFNEMLRDWASSSGVGRVVGPVLEIPDALIARLPEGPFTALVIIMAVLAVLTAVGAAANFGHAYLSITAVNNTVARVRLLAFRRALRSPLGVVARLGASDLVSRIVNDSTQLSNGLQVLLSKAVLQVFKGVAALIVALAFDARVTLGALLVAPALYTVIRRLGKRIKRAAGAALESQSDLMGHAGQALGGLRTVKAHGGERLEIGAFRQHNRDMLRELGRARTARALASPLTEMLSIFLLCGLVLLAGNLVIRGTVSAKDFILALASLAVAGAALKPLTGIINDIQMASPAAARLARVIDLAGEEPRARRTARLGRHRRSVSWEGVRFTYPGADAPAVRDVSLEVSHGERVAFVGPNGCGKTTLLSLLPRLFDPDTGTIRVDGVDVRTVSLRSLRAQIGVVSQDTVLFRGTVRENIAYGRLGATDDAVEHAARLARAHEFIERLPRGYGALLGEGGSGLSGGQRQRLAIARAVLRDPAILVLDEATSMIDGESEGRIAEAIAEFSVGRTTLVVAHRLSTVLMCDRIVVMQDGVIADVGRHDELLDRCELYRQLARGQLLVSGRG
ncbi:MAG: ABC transporter ATP-binding protein [Planctomycetota bacterium]|nr:ABC transporter ATP-binding protein [Planctomycetota bacterium]